MLTKEELISFSVELVQNNIDRITQGVSNFGSDTYKRIKIKSGNAFNNYLETAVRKYSEIKTILYRDAPVFLYDFFEDSELSFQEEMIDASELNNILQYGDKLLITGSAGTGKSTLMKHLFLATIALKKRIPIFVELKNINNIPNVTEQIVTGEYSLVDFMYHSVSLLNFDLEKEFFDKAINNGNLFFYFDGFDEVNPEIREQISMQIIQLADKYYENVIIVSSRPDDGFVSWNNFTELKMLPLSKAKALKLINKIQYDKEIKERFVEELNENLYFRHKSFASNPLLLTIMLMSFSQYSDIPEKMYLFYQQAFDTLFSKHDSTKGGYKRKMYSNVVIDDFVRVLSAFSIQSYSNNNISFDYSTIIKLLDAAKKITGIEYDTYYYYRDLCESVSLLVKDGFLYTYSHRIFQEYFSALFIINSSDDRQKKLLNKLSRRFDTDNIFDMLFEMDRNRLERNYIIPLLEEMRITTCFDTVSIEEASLNLVKNLFIKVLFKSGDEKLISYEIKNNDLFSFIRIVHRKYSEIYGLSNIRFPKRDGKIIFEKYLSSQESKRYIEINDLIEEFGKSEIIGAYPFVNEFVSLMDLLELLNGEHQRQDQSIDSILFD